MAQDNTTIALLGATRGIGRLVLEQALERGLRVRALVRRGSDLDVQHPRLTVVRGDATQPADVAEALRCTTAVLSALGTPARNRDGLRTAAAEATLAAMKQTGVDRLIAVSVYGVGDTRAQLPFFTRAIILPVFLRHPMADHAMQEQAVMASDVAWTLIRPPYLTDGPRTADYASAFGSQTAGLTWKISRADVAHFMLDTLVRGTHVRAAVGVSYRQRVASAA